MTVTAQSVGVTPSLQDRRCFGLQKLLLEELELGAEPAGSGHRCAVRGPGGALASCGRGACAAAGRDWRCHRGSSHGCWRQREAAGPRPSAAGPRPSAARQPGIFALRLLVLSSLGSSTAPHRLGCGFPGADPLRSGAGQGAQLLQPSGHSLSLNHPTPVPRQLAPVPW